MYTQRGANETLNLEALPIDEWHANEVYVYLSGYLLSTEPGREHSKSLLEGLNEKDIFTVLDTPPVDILRNIGKQKFLQTIGSLCAIFTTIDEGSFLTNHSHVEAVAAHLGELIPLVVIKLGRDGCWVQYDGVGQHVSTHPLNNVGATGAGDAFCGAFLCALSENAPAFEAAKRANEAAGFVIAKRKEA
jgi:sugar/nucleoside kinase (ribokinase family)